MPKESEPSEDQSAEEFARDLLQRQQRHEQVEELTGGMGAGSQVNIYQTAVDWTRIERLVGVIGVLIPVFWLLGQGFSIMIGIAVPETMPISAALGLSALGDYWIHRNEGARPEPPSLPHQQD
ncbi:hypothetical protein [Halostagnicola kamekurae]|uniref:hypothetical protein n=1 Tax=Halostagnicola kamekurae TaxID=619731 RepID=UPI0011141D26|nr:hypothetical protein [Halostagnicola kamekurae]